VLEIAIDCAVRYIHTLLRDHLVTIMLIRRSNNISFKRASSSPVIAPE
jgi:hypothetical protein